MNVSKRSNFTLTVGGVASIVCFSSLVSWVGVASVGGRVWLLIYLGIVGISFILLHQKLKGSNRYGLFFLLLVLLFFVVTLFGQMFHFDSNSMARLLLFIFGALFSWILVKENRGGFLFFVSSWFFIILYFALSVESRLSIIGVFGFDHGLGVNSIGFALVLSVSCLVVFRWRSDQSPPYIVLFLAFLSVLSHDYFARANVVSLVFIMSGVFLFYNNKNVPVKLFVLSVSAALLFLALALGLYSLSRGMSVGSRADIWLGYIEVLDWRSVLVGGVDLGNVSALAPWGGNVHNSYLNFHARHGVSVFVLLLVLGYAFFKTLQRKLYVLAFILVAATFRAITDIVVFGSYIDFLFFYVVWSALAVIASCSNHSSAAMLKCDFHPNVSKKSRAVF